MTQSDKDWGEIFASFKDFTRNQKRKSRYARRVVPLRFMTIASTATNAARMIRSVRWDRNGDRCSLRRIMGLLPELTPKQAEAVETLFELHWGARLDSPEARTAFLCRGAASRFYAVVFGRLTAAFAFVAFFLRGSRRRPISGRLTPTLSNWTTRRCDPVLAAKR